MDLGFADEPIGKTNRRNALSLAPPSATIQASQPPAIPDRVRDGNCLDLPDGADEFEVHLPRQGPIIAVPKALTTKLSRAGRHEYSRSATTFTVRDGWSAFVCAQHGRVVNEVQVLM